MDNNFMQVTGQYGWICPKCGRVLAPFVPECPCRGQGPETWTTTSTSSGNKTITLHNNEDISKHIPTIHTYYSEEGLENE